MRKILFRLILLALLFGGFWHFSATLWKTNPYTGDIGKQVDGDPSLPLSWPPRAEDGRTESILDALTLYFKTLFSADEVVQQAQEVADKAAQRQQDIEKQIESDVER